MVFRPCDVTFAMTVIGKEGNSRDQRRVRQLKVQKKIEQKKRCQIVYGIFVDRPYSSKSSV